MNKPIYVLLAVALLLGILLTSCSQATTTSAPPAGTTQAAGNTSTPAVSTPAGNTSTPAGNTSTTATQPTPTNGAQYGGTVNFVFFLGVVNIGDIPDYAAPYDTWIAACDLQSLLSINPDGSYGPLLATSYDVASDYSSVTFHLRKGVKFHDGTDFNAQAVKYNLDLFNKGNQDTIRYVSSVDVIDDYTVKVNFGHLQAGFLLPFAGRAGDIESPTALQNNPSSYFLEHTVGTGPFQFQSFVRDSHVTFTKYNNYWEPGKPYLDSINWMDIANTTTALMYFKAGQAQAMLYPSEKDIAGLEANGFQIQKGFGPEFSMLVDGGNADSPFHDLRVRQALAYAIDIPTMVKGLGYGYWTPLTQFSTPTDPYYDPSILGYPYNPAKAKQLLADAGYPNGFKTTIYSGSTSTASAMSAIIQSDLKAVGINASITVGTMANVAVWTQKGFTNGIQIYPAGGPGPYRDSRTGLALFGSQSGQFPELYHSAEIDNLIAQSDQELDTAKRMALYKQLDKLVVDNAVAIPLYFDPGHQALSADMGFWNFQAPTGETFQPQDVWLKK